MPVHRPPAVCGRVLCCGGASDLFDLVRLSASWLIGFIGNGVIGLVCAGCRQGSGNRLKATKSESLGVGAFAAKMPGRFD